MTTMSIERRPKLLDVCCGAGGAAQGYIDAGFDVYGIDDEDMPNYPGAFVQGSAVDLLDEDDNVVEIGLLTHLLRGGTINFGGEVLGLADFDAFHGSPPCQAHCMLTKGTNAGRFYPDLIPAVRAFFEATGMPYVIENVVGAPIRKDVWLCGEMFGLAVIRHRWFELGGWSMEQPAHPEHRGRVAGMRHGEWFEGPYFAVYGEGGGKGTVAQWQSAMGMDWTDVRKEIAEAIPPRYTTAIGERLLAVVADREEEEAA